jgi:hypothetical protein
MYAAAVDNEAGRRVLLNDCKRKERAKKKRGRARRRTRMRTTRRATEPCPRVTRLRT